MAVLASLRFPHGFLWGAATSAHQVEGNNINSDWWMREHAVGTTLAEPSGDACDSYHRYRQDMQLLADVGLNAYRFSLEWSRIEPEPGFVSRAQIDHYRRMVAACRELGLEPVLTLQHLTLPRWMAADGGWRHPEAVRLFARFTEIALPIISEGVAWVCTINEPNLVATTRELESNKGSLTAAADVQITAALVHAHRRSREVLSQVPGVRSGWTIATQALHPDPGCEQLAQEYGYPREGVFLEAARGDDFVGVQAYTRTFIGPSGPRPVPESAETTLMGWEYFPHALAIGVRHASDVTGGTPILVTENGIATSDDARRIGYTRDALTGLHAAIKEGVHVLGYLHWSALDNYEWGSYRPTFGLIAVDRETFARTPKRSARWLGAIAKANAIHV